MTFTEPQTTAEHNVREVRHARMDALSWGNTVRRFICPECKRELETTRAGLQEHVLTHRTQRVARKAVEWWTPERVAVLTQMWGNHPASKIAKEIGAKSRNAILGKAHRIGLPTLMPNVPGGPPPVRKAVRPAPAATAEQVAHRMARRAADLATVKAQDEIVGGKITFAKLQDHHCRWPFGDPRSASFRYCGDARAIRPSPLPGQPTAHAYCEAHCRMAYQRSEA